MKQISELLQLNFAPAVAQVKYKNERDELISSAVRDINSLREGTKFKKETEKNLALRINKNVFLGKHENNGELRMVLDDCRKKRSYSHLYWITK